MVTSTSSHPTGIINQTRQTSNIENEVFCWHTLQWNLDYPNTLLSEHLFWSLHVCIHWYATSIIQTLNYTNVFAWPQLVQTISFMNCFPKSHLKVASWMHIKLGIKVNLIYIYIYIYCLDDIFYTLVVFTENKTAISPTTHIRSTELPMCSKKSHAQSSYHAIMIPVLENT